MHETDETRMGTQIRVVEIRMVDGRRPHEERDEHEPENES